MPFDSRACLASSTHSLSPSLLIYRTILLLAAIYIFYTIPLTLATGLVDPAKWADIFGQEWNPSPFYSKYLVRPEDVCFHPGMLYANISRFSDVAEWHTTSTSVDGLLCALPIDVQVFGELWE